MKPVGFGSPFVPGARVVIEPVASGLLDGLTFSVKDLIDVKGTKTCCGNPAWCASESVAERSANCVNALLLSGARLVGKTITDEFAFSLEGRNPHYSIPLNPQCPACLPGGSSSGSASAVAQGLSDLALGTDTGGSVRIPAAFCGIYGIRPTHGAVSLHGTMPFSPSYDTVGWFARDLDVIQRAARVLLPEQRDNDRALPLENLKYAIDTFSLCDENVRTSILSGLSHNHCFDSVQVFGESYVDWVDSYVALQGREIWETLGKKLFRDNVALGESAYERFFQASRVDEISFKNALSCKSNCKQVLDGIIPRDGALIIPTSPVTALSKTVTKERLKIFYNTSLAINSIAGHAGLPQLCIPVGKVNECPIGYSIIGRKNDDLRLIATAQSLMGKTSV